MGTPETRIYKVQFAGAPRSIERKVSELLPHDDPDSFDLPLSDYRVLKFTDQGEPIFSSADLGAVDDHADAVDGGELPQPGGSGDATYDVYMSSVTTTPNPDALPKSNDPSVLSTFFANSPLLTPGDKLNIAFNSIPRSKIDPTDPEWQAAEQKEYDGISKIITEVNSVPAGADLIPASTNYKEKRADETGKISKKVRILALGDQSWLNFEKHETEAITARRDSLPLILIIALTLGMLSWWSADIGQAFLHGLAFPAPRFLRAPPCACGTWKWGPGIFWRIT